MPEEKQIPNAYLTPTVDTSNTKLLEISGDWYEESKKYHTELQKVWKQNEDYYLGKQTNIDKIPSDMSNAVQNHVYMGVETVVPIITANPPQFVVEPPEESDTSIRYADAVQQVLGIQYENADVRTEGEQLIRHMVLYRAGIWKIEWNEDEDRPDVRAIRPHRVYFPKVSGDLPYVMEQIDLTSEEFRDYFGEDKFKDFLENRGEDFNPEEEDWIKKVSGIWTIWEIWTKNMVFWRSGSMIIDKKDNPNYDFNNKPKNHFKTPQLPYIIASPFKLGDAPIGNTDLIQQTIPIQDVINVSNRLIINNANKMGNAQWFIDPQAMTEEEANTKITNTTGLIIFGPGVANEGLVRRDAPPPLPPYIVELKAMAEKAFDNIFGTHSTTRGEREAQETLGGRMLLKQADLGRIDLLVREYERVVSVLGNWFTQLMKLNYTNKKSFKIYGESGAKFVNIISEMIEKGVRVITKSGTTLPTDELSKRREALELWGLNAMDPETLYERLKFPNPEDAAKRLRAWLVERSVDLGEDSVDNPTNNQRKTKPAPSAQNEMGRRQKQMTGGQ